jgi:NAD(P)-dependent dehydrogenase (short-subunit alcohol dehydrogenase family)
MPEPVTVLITGASGLLGRALCAAFDRHGHRVLAHYFSSPGDGTSASAWLQGDLSSLEGVERFTARHHDRLTNCQILINNYGPLADQPFELVEACDLVNDFIRNAASAMALTRALIAMAPLLSVVNIGYSEAGQIKAFRRVTGYAAAKNALLLFTRSLAVTFPAIRFNMLSPHTLQGARVAKPADAPVAPQIVAERAMRLALGRATGRHVRL